MRKVVSSAGGRWAFALVAGALGCGGGDGGGGSPDADGSDDGLPTAGLVVHYRADRGVVTNGSDVIRWEDQGPGAHHAVPLAGPQFTSPKRVERNVVGGVRPAVEFGGAELIGCAANACSGLIADVVASSPLTILAVAQLDPPDTGVAEHPLLSSPANDPEVSPTETTELRSRYPGGAFEGIQLMVVSDGGGGIVQLDSADVAWEPHIWVATIDADVPHFSVDELIAGFDDATSATLEGLRLGINPNDNRTLDGVLFEVVLYDRVLDPAELEQARATLTARWLAP